ncbi:hypothetical protein KK083_15235 [Fulvivirgaceae bacterium PWU4]|uniref:VRR-NUC domain-containing protein n=1 Tax=Chryseosolibacter histidini TaxID=2782349 RepID=A0AAP2GPS2_9BACT|nr:hypothetical protein [Chryseosolibacter histidini]MBT1698245.1 hypothetical protein [Chryseosolibacter histidini]
MSKILTQQYPNQDPMNALKELQDLHQNDKKKRYPNVPDHCLPNSKFTDTTANGLTKAIITWLTLNGCWATRINTTGRFLKGNTITDAVGRARVMKGAWIPGTTRNGTADIHAIINGRHVSIEVKIGRDRMSPAQHKTQEAIEQCGGVYIVARTFDEFLRWWNNFVLREKRDSQIMLNDKSKRL